MAKKLIMGHSVHISTIVNFLIFRVNYNCNETLHIFVLQKLSFTLKCFAKQKYKRNIKI